MPEKKLDPHEEKEQMLYQARWRARLPQMRRDIAELTGAEVTAELLPDPILAGIAERAKQVAEIAAGQEPSMSRAAAVGFCAATATALIAEQIIHLRGIVETREWESFEAQIKRKAETVARSAFEAEIKKHQALIDADEDEPLN